MYRKPRDISAPMLSGFMTWRILLVSLLMVLGTFGLFLWECLHRAEIEVARTVAVNTLVIAEVFYLFNTRYLSASAIAFGILEQFVIHIHQWREIIELWQ